MGCGVVPDRGRVVLLVLLVVVLLLVLVSDACSEMGCVWPQVIETNWQP